MREEFVVKIIGEEVVTHDVKRIRVEKPQNYEFTPGQATLVSVNMPGWKDNRHEFTFTSLNLDPFLEFTIKSYPVSVYPDHEGVTELIHKLKKNDELVIQKPFGTIQYKGRGVFVAGGAGITPFIAIFKDLDRKNELSGNKLIFSNKTERDIVLEDWLRKIFSQNDLILTLTREKKEGYRYGRVDEVFLKSAVKSFDTNFYVCGPGKMVKDIKSILHNLGADVNSIVFEE